MDRGASVDQEFRELSADSTDDIQSASGDERSNSNLVPAEEAQPIGIQYVNDAIFIIFVVYGVCIILNK